MTSWLPISQVKRVIEKQRLWGIAEPSEWPKPFKSPSHITDLHSDFTDSRPLQSLLPPSPLDLITQLVVSVSFRRPRFYDLQLDHWGFSKVGKESFLEMSTRLRPIVELWWEGTQNPVLPPHNGFYDNSIPGVNALNNFASAPAHNTFYFTMSFDATVDFPKESLSSADIAELPFTFPLNLWNPLNIPSTLGAVGLSLSSHIPGVPSLVNLAKWASQVANNHLGALGYFNRIPQPGPKVPRADMLPLMLPTAYAMGGYELPARTAQLIAGISSTDFQPNDGIVNTVSMRGPNDAHVSNAVHFPVQSLGNPTLAMVTKGTYWHLGINKTMDHGDQIGVFTVGQTVSCNDCLIYYCGNEADGISTYIVRGSQANVSGICKASYAFAIELPTESKRLK